MEISSIKCTFTNLKRIHSGHFFYTILCHHILQYENVIISQNGIILFISFFGGSNNIFANCISIFYINKKFYICLKEVKLSTILFYMSFSIRKCIQSLNLPTVVRHSNLALLIVRHSSQPILSINLIQPNQQ